MATALFRTCLLTGLLALQAMLLPGLATAAPAQPGAPLMLAQSGEMTLDQSTQMVRERTGGRVLSARQVQRNGNRMHEVRVLISEGNVRVYRVDPATGRMR